MNDPKTAFYKASQWKNAFSQTGTDIPTFSQGSGGADVSGTGIPSLSVQDQYEQEGAGPLFGQSLISASHSYDLRYPKMPVVGGSEQSVEGIPNATPEMLRKYVERKLRNPGGQELPGFVKGA